MTDGEERQRGPERREPPYPGWRRDARWRDGARWPGDARWRGNARWRAGHRAPGCFGCFLVALILVIGAITAISTWVAGTLLGLVSPDARPSSGTAVAVIVVVVLGVLVVARIVGRSVGPLSELAAATGRLADGEPGVRVRPRGPRPLRGLTVSFNLMATRLDRARDDRRALLADVTHELRTPLTVISGGIEAMLDGVHPLDVDHLSPILAEAKVMDRLLDDLRTVSLAEAGALPLHREPVDLASLAAEVVAAHGPAATAAGVDLRSTGAEPVPADVDPVRVREILVNLVTNALRHTPAGGRVEVDVRREGDDAVLTVRDTGEGIPAADLARVFDRFHRRADSGGSGLGLTIARDLAVAHGGSIDVESTGVQGQGATFRVRLPRRA